MSKIRYRCEASTTLRAEQRFHHVHRLGRIVSIRGYRFVSTRLDSEGKPYTTDHERVIVKGHNGTARFSGLCWGYKGSGPHGLARLLEECGLAPEVAKEIAFGAPRRQGPGSDWRIDMKLFITINIPTASITKAA